MGLAVFSSPDILKLSCHGRAGSLVRNKHSHERPHVLHLCHVPKNVTDKVMDRRNRDADRGATISTMALTNEFFMVFIWTVVTHENVIIQNVSGEASPGQVKLPATDPLSGEMRC